MQDSRILAVDHVHLEVRSGLTGKLIWFYGEIGGLALVPRRPADPYALRFRSGPLEVRMQEVENPVVDGVDCELTILVDSLAETRQGLEQARIEFDRLSPTVQTDRRLSLLDPVGHRVEFKQFWPYAPL